MKLKFVSFDGDRILLSVLMPCWFKMSLAWDPLLLLSSTTHDLSKSSLTFFLPKRLDLNQFSCLIIFFHLQFVSPSVHDMIISNQDQRMRRKLEKDFGLETWIFDFFWNRSFVNCATFKISKYCGFWNLTRSALRGSGKRNYCLSIKGTRLFLFCDNIIHQKSDTLLTCPLAVQTSLRVFNSHHFLKADLVSHRKERHKKYI